jgi:hypothetical protein
MFCWEGLLRLSELVRFRRNGRLLYHKPLGPVKFHRLTFQVPAPAWGVPLSEGLTGEKLVKASPKIPR